MKLTRKLLAVFALSGASYVSILSAEVTPTKMPSAEEMWRIIQAQQKQIDSLTKLTKNNQQVVTTTRSEAASAKKIASSTRKELVNTQAQLEATTLAVEEGGSSFGSGWWEKTSVGGYGELHANFPEDSENTIDFHRFVLFVNHEYNDWITLYTELELEHSLSGNGKPGEVELEQAFLRMDWTESFSTDAGLFILPIGITNETHEPNTFYGVERNEIEKYIIPTTWWEGGLKGSYRFDNGFAVDGAVTSGLDVAGGYIRGGRQKVASAPNEEAAFTGRVKYTGIAGLEVAASVFYQDDLAQTDAAADYSGLLTTAHVDYSVDNFRIRALYAQWDLSGDVALDAEKQKGFYIEPSYRFELSEKYGDLGAYVRYSDFEYYNGSLKEKEIYELGVNYWPTDNVVFKADYQDVVDSEDAINLGVGYQF
ncbi:MAG: porin [Opitutaceae bacterium]